MQNVVTISNAGTSASFNVRGAELHRLTHAGRDQLWHGDPVWWDFRAPILFPVIGRSPHDRIRISEIQYPMPSHGFARDRDFRLVEGSADRVAFELFDDDASRAMFPFPFVLRIEAVARDSELALTASIRNRGTEAMPYCFGFHPAFLWPQEVAARNRYVCLFEKAEAETIRRPDLPSGLLKRQCFASPLVDRTLRLDDGLFADGALIFDAVRSRRLWFGPPGANGIEVDFPDCPQLGIWTKPGAPFLCIEPWQGTSAIEGSDGMLSSRPGVRHLAPEETHRYRLSVRLDVSAHDAARFDSGAQV